MRNMSYIKPLNGSLGPKQTKCEIKDEVAYCDFDQYVSTVTTTRTPDVPSGGVFSVKTRTCIMWAGPISSKVIVTTQVEWTGRSFIKGMCYLHYECVCSILRGRASSSAVGVAIQDDSLAYIMVALMLWFYAVFHSFPDPFRACCAGC